MLNGHPGLILMIRLNNEERQVRVGGYEPQVCSRQHGPWGMSGLAAWLLPTGFEWDIPPIHSVSVSGQVPGPFLTLLPTDAPLPCPTPPQI